MVAVVLGLLVVGAALQVYLGAQSAYRYNQALAAVHDRGRFALYTLVHDLRLAGYTGCAQGLSTAPSVVGASGGRHPHFGRVTVIANEALEAGLSGADILVEPVDEPRAGELPADAVAGTDAIRIAYMRDGGVRVADTSPDNANVKVTANPAGWEAEDILLVTDCVSADLFAATNVSQAGSDPWTTIAHSNATNNGNRLSRLYPPHSRVMQPAAYVYYVGASEQTDAAGNAVPALYRKAVFPAPVPAQQLVLGISDLTLRYGIDSSNDQSPDDYVAAASVADWEQVVAVRLAFVAVSPERSGGDNPSLKIFGAAVTVPDDGRLRRVFSSTVAMRNRVP